MAATIIALGRLTKDAEQRTAGTSKATTFSVAVDVYDRKEKKKTSMFYDCSWFGGAQADALKPILTKGTQVEVVGEHSTREYQGKTHQQIDVRIVNLAGGKRDGSNAVPTEHETAKANGYTDDNYGAKKQDDDLPF